MEHGNDKEQKQIKVRQVEVFKELDQVEHKIRVELIETERLDMKFKQEMDEIVALKFKIERLTPQHRSYEKAS